MKLSPMIVQALWNTKSPLLQLPHITESHLRFFETKKVWKIRFEQNIRFFLFKHTIKSIRQFAAMDNDARRSMLRSITDEQYDDIMNVLSIYPYVTMDVSCEVFDDEEVHKITTGAVVTLTIHEINEDQRDDKENQEKVERFFFRIY